MIQKQNRDNLGGRDMNKRIAIGLMTVSLYFTNSMGVFGQEIILTHSSDRLYHQIVNKQYILDRDYRPDVLVIPKVKVLEPGNIEKNHMEETAATQLEQLFKAASKEKVELVAVSGYRSYNRQKTIYNNYIKQYGRAYTDTVSAQPGKSEHQTGLAMDVSAKSVGYSLTEKFGTTKEGKWLAEKAHQYGFILRYPKGKEKITGYAYEPWHIRYVGKELATALYTNQLTLEEVTLVFEDEKKANTYEEQVEVIDQVSVIEQVENDDTKKNIHTESLFYKTLQLFGTIVREGEQKNANLKENSSF